MIDTEIYRVISDDPHDVMITKEIPGHVPHAVIHRLVADEGKHLRKGDIICTEAIVADVTGWQECDTEITPEEFISILLGEE